MNAQVGDNALLRLVFLREIHRRRIGLSLFGKLRFLKPTTMVILGSIVYQACLSIATYLGVPSAYNKLIMAVLFTIALVFSNFLKKGESKA